MPEPDAETVFEEIRKGNTTAAGKAARVKGPGLTVRHLAPFFDASNWSGFDDSDSVCRLYLIDSISLRLANILITQGFHTLYRNLFSRLALEEAEWSGHSVSDYPSFGYASWTWSGPGKGQPNSHEGARFFYNYWLSFATEKDFSWIEAWSTNEAPDRQIRRLMEKDNKKARDTARKEYNDTVRVCDHLDLGLRSRLSCLYLYLVSCHFHPETRSALQVPHRPTKGGCSSKSRGHVHSEQDSKERLFHAPG